MAITRISQSTIKEGLEKFNSFLGGYAGVFGNYESISTVVVGTTTVNLISIDNIPTNYQHLQLRITARTGRSLHVDGLNITFNRDSGSNYTTHWFYGDGSSVLNSTTISSSAGVGLARVAGNNATANLFGSIIVDILDYSSSTKNKVLRVSGGTDNNGQGEIHASGGLWVNTAPITSISLTSFISSNILQHSNFSLYGISQ